MDWTSRVSVSSKLRLRFEISSKVLSNTAQARRSVDGLIRTNLQSCRIVLMKRVLKEAPCFLEQTLFQHPLVRVLLSPGPKPFVGRKRADLVVHQRWNTSRAPPILVFHYVACKRGLVRTEEIFYIIFIKLEMKVPIGVGG